MAEVKTSLHSNEVAITKMRLLIASVLVSGMPVEIAAHTTNYSTTTHNLRMGRAAATIMPI